MFESLRGNLPLADFAVLLVRLLFISGLFREPSGILRLFHDDLDASTCSMQLVVNSRDKLFGSIDRFLFLFLAWATLIFFAVLTTTHLLLQRHLTLETTAAAREGSLQAHVGLKHLLVLSLFLKLALFFCLFPSLDLRCSPSKDLVDNGATLNEMLQIFGSFRSSFRNLIGGYGSTFSLETTIGMRRVYLVDRALIQGLS